MTYAEQTLAVLETSLSSMSIAMLGVYRNVTVAQSNLGKYKEALFFYHKSKVILWKILEPNHPRVAQIKQDIVQATARSTYHLFKNRFDSLLETLIKAQSSK